MHGETVKFDTNIWFWRGDTLLVFCWTETI